MDKEREEVIRKAVDKVLKEYRETIKLLSKDSAQVFKCPNCGSNDCWFDRTISYSLDGSEDGMHMRCSGCGRTFDELFPDK